MSRCNRFLEGITAVQRRFFRCGKSSDTDKRHIVVLDAPDRVVVRTRALKRAVAARRASLRSCVKNRSADENARSKGG